MTSRLAHSLSSFVALALAACSSRAPEHLERAERAALARRPQEALKEYRLALGFIDQTGGGHADELRARALRGAADVYNFQLSEPKRAAEVYRELVLRCPEAPQTFQARLYLADILRTHLHDARGAIAELTAASERGPPKSAELHYEIAKLYFELGDFKQCALEAQALARKHETSPYADDALFLRAQALAMLGGRKLAAIAAFDDLLRRHPGSELHPHALLELGRLREEDGDIEAAIEAYVRALEKHPQPAVVQDAIVSARRRLVATTPSNIGDQAKAFEQPERPARSP